MNRYGVIFEPSGRGDAGLFADVDDFAVVTLSPISDSLCTGAADIPSDEAIQSDVAAEAKPAMVMKIVRD